jgi:hypothetical protein
VNADPLFSHPDAAPHTDAATTATVDLEFSDSDVDSSSTGQQ